MDNFSLNSLLLMVLCMGVQVALLAQDPHSSIPDSGRHKTVGTPYDPAGAHRTWSIKGKVLPFIVGNEAGASGLLGLEYGLTKNQSIGIDAFAEYQESAHDNVSDTAGVQHATGEYWHSWEKAIFLNYRYYFREKDGREDGIAPYIVGFLRYGRIDRYYDPLYVLSSYLSEHERHYSAGLLGGFTGSLSDKHRLGLDINTGLFIKKKDIWTVYRENDSERITRRRPIGPGFRLSVNLVWWFPR